MNKCKYLISGVFKNLNQVVQLPVKGTFQTVGITTNWMTENLHRGQVFAHTAGFLFVSEFGLKTAVTNWMLCSSDDTGSAITGTVVYSIWV